MAGIDGNTVLLLHCDGSDGATTFTDISDSIHAITAVGNAQVDTAQSKFGGAALLCDGTGDYLTVPDHANFNFGTGNFTWDFWVRFASLSNEDGLIGISNSASGQDTANMTTLRLDPSAGSTNINFRVDEASSTLIDFNGAHGMVADTWYHVALVRGWGGNANDWAITVAGSSIVTLTDADPWPDFTSGFYMGFSARAGNQYLNGWMDEIRVLKGEAGWTANFTPPTEAYTIATASGFLNLLLLGAG